MFLGIVAKKLFIEIFFIENWLSVRRMGRDRLESFLYKLMVNLYTRPGTDILSTDRYSVYIFFMSSEKLGISQSNFETLIKVQKKHFYSLFLKFETPVHS